MLSELADAVAVCTELRDVGEVSDGERIDRIARLERLKAAAAGLQAAESVRFAQSQVAQQIAADVHPKAIGRGIADQLALAYKVSPTEGRAGWAWPGPCGSTCREPSGCSLVDSSVSTWPLWWCRRPGTSTPEPDVRWTPKSSRPVLPGWGRVGRRRVPAAT